MISPFHGNNYPFELPSNIVYFHDWRYVNTGGYCWVGSNEEPLPLFMSDPVPPAHYQYHAMPIGIRLQAMPAKKSEPVIFPDPINEVVLFGGSLIHEDGRYRLWFETWPYEDLPIPGRMGFNNLLRYAESENGTNWKFPAQGLIERNDSRNNNIVFGGTSSPSTGFHGSCVFKDSSAPASERYKIFHYGYVSQEHTEKYLRERPEEVDRFHLAKPTGLFGAVSPDGFHWTPLPDPLLIQTSDTHNICEYDPVLGQYVAYCRSWYFNRRTIGRTATKDFRRFPLPEELFWPAGHMQPYETWYANGKTKMPGTNDYHVMFPMRWGLTEDKFDFFLAASPDNVVWNFVPSGPVCAPGNAGDWDGGVVVPGLGMVNLPGDKMGILMEASHVPHKFPRKPPLGVLAWATWPKGRLVALQAQGEGSFSLWPLKFKGRTVHLNFKTALTGYIKVQASDSEGKILHAFDDCDHPCGNHLDRVLTWKGESDLGHSPDSPVTLAFQLRNAELYSVEFK